MPNEITTIRRSLAPATFGEAIEFSRMLAKSDMVPAAYRNKPENVLLAIQWGMEVGLGPLQAIQNIAVINGKPSVYGDALLGMVRGSSVCEDVVESFEGEGDDLAAVCIAKRRGAAPVPARFSVTDAKKAGLWNKAGPWQQYPRRMLQMRARGFALRDAFPDVLRGVITREEAEDYPQSQGPIDITPRDTRADLDAFANAKPVEMVDEITGEILDAETVEANARPVAACGTDTFRKYLRSISRAAREILNGKVGTKEQPGELLRLAIEADERAAQDSPSGSGNSAEQPQTLRKDADGGQDRSAPETAQSPPGGEINDLLGGPARKPAGYYKVRREGNTTDDWLAWERALQTMIDNPADPNDAILRDNKDDLGKYAQMEPMRHNRLMRALQPPADTARAG